MKRINLAILASGTGSNAKKIIDYFRNSDQARVRLVACNKPGAGVLQIADEAGIPQLLLEKAAFKQDGYSNYFKENGIDFIILAGFLWKIPETLVAAYPRRMINIHPALLPAYGGKGMYGSFVHEAVIRDGASESGITIHYVDEQYDHGAVIFQARCPVLPADDAASLADRIHALEHQHYPLVISALINGLQKDLKA